LLTPCHGAYFRYYAESFHFFAAASLMLSLLSPMADA